MLNTTDHSTAETLPSTLENGPLMKEPYQPGGNASNHLKIIQIKGARRGPGPFEISNRTLSRGYFFCPFSCSVPEPIEAPIR